MKYQLTTLHLLVVLVIAFLVVQNNIIPSDQKYLIGWICVLVSLVIFSKIVKALGKGAISTGITIIPNFLFKATYSTSNSALGTYFEKSVNPKRFWSAVRSSLYVAVLFGLIGALIVLNLI